ncbi:lytic transglycosylase domain-containing protein, partial [Methylocapsa palsarum]
MNAPGVRLFAAAATAQMLPAAHAAPADPFADFVLEASQRFGVPADWIRAVMRAESRGEWRATSPKGAMGLMQIMPSTWTLLRSRFNLGADPYDPRDNILAGAGFLRELCDRYGSPGFLAAYNAGPGRYCPASAPMRQIGVFSEGRFLVHLSPFRSADETEIRAGESPGRTACERYS